MPPKGASDDLKSHIPVLYGEGYSVKDICHLLSIKKSLIYRVLNQYHCYGTISNPNTYSCPHHPSIYLDKLKEQLSLQCNVHVSMATISHALKKLGITHKTVSACAQEWNELARAMYMNKIANEVPDPNMLLFINEVARDKRTIARRYGHAGRGDHCTIWW
ncbi:hypothetical protein J3A83DRAFT_4185721 [Scleroderma citrinum]